MSEPIRTHFISKVHTDPWMTPNGQLHFFDFRDGTFGSESAKSLLARDRLNDPDVEGQLNRLMERQIGILRARATDGRYVLKSWREYRAIALLLMLQGPRSSAALDTRDHSAPLATLLRMSDREIDTLIQKFYEHKNLIWHRLPPREPLLFPSTGIFVLPVFDDAAPGGVDFAFATPLDTRTLVAAVSNSADYESFAKAAKDGFYYSGLSVGLNSDLVLIPPDLVGRDGAETLKGWRETSCNHVRFVNQIRDVATLAQSIGMKVDVRERFIHAAGIDSQAAASVQREEVPDRK
jgi:hypothetical protein